MVHQAPETALAAFRGLCPRCGAAGLFDGIIKFSPKCSTCGLNYNQFNVGDGPAAFLIMIVGAIVIIAAIIVELKFAPPFWVHIILWIPISTILVIGLLRVAKGALLVLEYRNRAREGRLSE
jgi:uncharacterized protein (DUF983 family)